MNRNLITALSIGLNGVLILGLGWLIVRPASTTRELVAPTPPRLGIDGPAEPAPPRPIVQPPAAGRPFHWSQLESTDYLAYIANLRRIGCPEETIRDIIVADVTKLFAPRYAALKKGAPELAWWGRFDKHKPVRAELAVKLRALHAEKRALLVRLLGNDVGADSAFAEATAAIVREQGAFDFVAAEKQTALRDILNRYDALEEWSRSQWKGLSSDEREAREKELRQARTRELAGLLSPDELREFEFRQSPASDLLREQFGRADLSESEFRRLHELRQDFEQRYPDARNDDWKRLEAEYRTALGPERFGDIERQNDSAWRGMQSLASDYKLSPDALQEAYGLHQSYREKLVQAVGQMFADPQQNPQPLRDLAAERDRQLAAILGAGVVDQLNRLDALPRLVVKDDGQRKSYSFSQGGFE